MTDPFEKLAEKLSDKDKAEFFRIMREIGITTKADTSLAKLLLALQLYKAYYESVPTAVNEATSNMARLKTEIEKLAKQAEHSANAGASSLHRIMNGATEMNELLKGIHSHIEESANKASTVVSKQMEELLTDAMKKALPLSDLAEADETFSEAIRESNHASEELRENVKEVRRARFGTLAVGFALTFIFAILGTGGYFYSWSERRIDEMRSYYIREISGNNRIVEELAKSKRMLIFETDTDGTKILAMKNAKGHTSNNHGVIEFK